MLSSAYLMEEDSAHVRGTQKGQRIAGQHSHHALHANHENALSLKDGVKALQLPDSAVKTIAICALQLATSALQKLSIAVSKNGYVGCSITDADAKTMIMAEAIASVNLVLYM